MNQILHKTLLDTLLDPTQKNPFSKSFAFDWARSAGNTSRIKGDFSDGREYIGTDQDDTVVITGNIIGSDKNPTSIDLLDGNDTLTVRGKLIAKEGQYLSITGGEGDKTINLNGGIDFTSTRTDQFDKSSVNISFSGSGDNTINVKGDIILNASMPESYLNYNTNLRFNLSNYTEEDIKTVNIIDINGSIISYGNNDISFYLDGYENSFLVNNDVILNQDSKLSVGFDGHNNTCEVYGDFIIDNATASFEEVGTHGSTLSVYIDGQLKIIDGTFFWLSDDTDNPTFTFNDISITNGSFDIDCAYGFKSSMTINGNIEVNNGGEININLFSQDISTIEIDGQIILHGAKTGDQSYSYITSDYGDDLYSLLGGISNDSMTFEIYSGYGNDDIYVGNMSATGNGKNIIDAGDGNDIIKISGDISASNGGTNSILAGDDDDIITLNGHVGVGALNIDGGKGNDTLVLSAATQNLFEADYKEWLTDLSSTGSLSKCNIETIRLDVRGLHIEKLGWFTDIVNKANADGAHIAVEDKAGHQLVNPSAYLAQNNETHNPINDVLDHYAPAAANAAQPKAFAENAANSSNDAFNAPHFDNNSFLHEMEQQAQVHAAAAA